MRVFILSTGRCGSTTFAKACKHIENYTSKHESLSNKFGSERFNFPENHIEADNRLSWHIGELDSIFGDEAFYVHLKRNKDAVLKSFIKRINSPVSIVKAYCNGIKMTALKDMSNKEKLVACSDYINTVNTNIEFLLSTKSKKMVINLETISEDFPIFWNLIGAKGDLSLAMDEFKTNHNYSKSNWINFKIKMYNTFIRPLIKK